MPAGTPRRLWSRSPWFHARQGKRFPNHSSTRSPRRNFSVLELLHLVVQADRPEHVEALLAQWRSAFSCTGAVGGLIRLGSNRTFLKFVQIVNAGYPDEWLSMYLNRGLAEVDPALKSALNASGAVHWQAVAQSLSSDYARRFLAAMRRCGLRDGMTAADVDRLCGLAVFCSFASDRELDAERVVPLARYVGLAILQAIRRTALPTGTAKPRLRQPLSARELTILNWIKLGKTNSEISSILGRSERTVRFHVESIFAKLDVISRSQAVGVAIEAGLFDLAS